MKLTRRHFLLGLGSAGAAVLAAGGAAYKFRDKFIKLQNSDIIAVVRENFPYLKLALTDEQFEEFATTYRQAYGEFDKPWYRRLRGWSQEETRSRYDHIANTFLLSTDFFLSGADESKPVNFVSFYDPYISPCWSPIRISEMG